jgi:hypothetical protein
MNAFRHCCAAAILAIALGFSYQARANLEIKVTDGVNTQTVDDLGTGSASYSGILGNFHGSAQGLGFPAVGSPSDPFLDLSSLDFTTAAGGGTLTVSLTETDFTAIIGPASFRSIITGVYRSSSATMNTYLDTTNVPFGMGTSLSSGLLNNQSDVVLLPTVTGPYSLTEVVTVTAGSSSSASIDTAITAAPEPASLSLLGAALAAFGMIGSRHLLASGCSRAARASLRAQPAPRRITA